MRIYRIRAIDNAQLHIAGYAYVIGLFFSLLTQALLTGTRPAKSRSGPICAVCRQLDRFLASNELINSLARSIITGKLLPVRPRLRRSRLSLAACSVGATDSRASCSLTLTMKPTAASSAVRAGDASRVIDGGAPVHTKPFLNTVAAGEEEVRAAIEVIRSGMLMGFVGSPAPEVMRGKAVRALEDGWQVHFEVAHAVSCNSATSGLIMAPGTAGIGPSEEVIVNP